MFSCFLRKKEKKAKQDKTKALAKKQQKSNLKNENLNRTLLACWERIARIWT